MSDERDSADATGDGTTDSGAGNRGGQTAVVTPARPTGKRTRQRALSTTEVDDDTEVAESGDGSTTPGKGTKTPKQKAKKDGKGGGGIFAPFKFVWTYMTQVVAELRKVIWPNRKQMVSYTTVVLVFLAFMVALIGVVDLGLAKLVLLVFG